MATGSLASGRGKVRYELKFPYRDFVIAMVTRIVTRIMTMLMGYVPMMTRRDWTRGETVRGRQRRRRRQRWDCLT